MMKRLHLITLSVMMLIILLYVSYVNTKQVQEPFVDRVKQGVRSNMRTGRRTLTGHVNKASRQGRLWLRKFGFL